MEADFKRKNQDIDFTKVDKMEALAIKSAQMQAFLKQGQVDLPKGSTP